MMSQVIRQESMVFLLSVAHGAALTFFYDVIRAFRRAVKHNLFAVSLEDFLFWITAGFLTFCLTYFYTDGVIRGYVAAGIGIGVVLYHCSVSKLILSVFTGVFRGIRVICRRILSFLQEPLQKICQFSKKNIELLGKRGYNGCIKRKLRGISHGGKKKTQRK